MPADELPVGIPIRGESDLSHSRDKLLSHCRGDEIQIRCLVIGVGVQRLDSVALYFEQGVQLVLVLSALGEIIFSENTRFTIEFC